MSDAWSITDGYWDTGGTWHATSDDTRAALRAAMGGTGLDEPPAPPPMWFVRAGEAPGLAGPCHLLLEDGATVEATAALPPDLPLGYHTLVPHDGGPSTSLVVTPGVCRIPDRAWGWAVQLYALRSAASWGVGDLGDLRDLAAWSASLGAGVTMVSPFHAVPPHPDHEPSPYYGASRVWRNVLLIRVADVPGATGHPDLARLDAAGRALSSADRLDRAGAYRAKLEALDVLYRGFDDLGGAREAFEGWRADQGASLDQHALWCALSEHHGPDWHTWPDELRHPGTEAVGAFAREQADRVRFHAWCQWLVDQQLRAAGTAGVDLVADVAVGFDPAGAEAWAHQDVLGTGCTVGAPPDDFAPNGQDWGLPPFVPWKLRAARYQPFVDTVRSAFTGCGGIRIDHVMGLFRLFWIPPGAPPAEGAYVSYPAGDLLDLLALEAHRAGQAFVVGEDLGTVQDEVRAELAGRGVLSYRLLWFEDRPPAELPEQALAAVSTHDLPTVAGVWTGEDQAGRRAIGVTSPADESDEDPFKPKLRELTGLGDDAGLDDVIVATHRALAGAPSRLLLATLDDAAGSHQRPNLPGTLDEWPNWRVPLPLTLEDLEASLLARRVAAALDHAVHPVAPPLDE